jgi:uncharacterized protein YbaP (TraB family)
MLHRWKARFGAMILAAGLASGSAFAEAPIATPAAPAATALTPALWTIAKPDGGTIALFGSVHLLPTDQDWHTDALKAAFDKADTIVFETPIADMATPELQAYLQQEMMNPPGVTLSSLLSAEEKAAVEAAAQALGAPFSALEPLRPWMAGLQLAVGFAVKQGMDPNSGVDKIIEADGKAAGKGAAYFETGREQLEIFTTLTQQQEIAFLVVGARDMLAKPDQLKELIAAWGRGDVAAIDDLMNGSIEEMPELGKKLLEDRNARWVDKIAGEFMADGKSYLIVVGAAHLAGDKSVPAMLRARGIAVDGP